MLRLAILYAFRTDASILASSLDLQAMHLTPSFADFTEKYNRSYTHGSDEYSLRQNMYEKRAIEAAVQNRKPGRLWTAGLNEYWDWTLAEVATLTGWKGSLRTSTGFGGSRLQSVRKIQFLDKGNKTLPVSSTWGSLQSSQHIYNQGSCGSCWAIAAATILGAAAELHGRPRTFSVQEMVSCVPNPRECGGQGGCSGATVELAVDWVMKHGIKQEHEVNYQAADTPCSAVPATGVSYVGTTFGMQGWETLPSNQYLPLLWAIFQRGPTAVSVGTEGWLSYSSGIFNSCPADSIVNHAVVAIGYGQDGVGTKFWHLQNSWGAGWGEQGMMRLLRRDTDEHECGIDREPQMGVECKGGPSQVTVCGMCGVLYDSVVVYFS